MDVISRRDAQSQGKKRFFTGEACNRGHISERFTANGNCVRCQTFSTPNKGRGPRGRNVGWPAVGLVFNVPAVSPDEMEAAFRLMEAFGWHDAAVMELRNKPELFERYRTKITPQEVGMLEAKLQRARTNGQPMVERIVTPICGGGQFYYGPPVRIGDSIMCQFCKKEEQIAEIS